MSPKIAYACDPDVDTPIFAWLPSGSAMPSRPSVLPCQSPVVAISTGPGFPRDGSQHLGTGASAVVVGISGFVHHVAARSGSAPNSAETICHGGTWRFEGLEINTTPLESLSLVGFVLVESFPSALTNA